MASSQPPLTFFLLVLEQLGETGEEQASALGISRRTVGRYERGLPRVVRVLMEHPILLVALLLDALLWQQRRRRQDEPRPRDPV